MKDNKNHSPKSIDYKKRTAILGVMAVAALPFAASSVSDSERASSSTTAAAASSTKSKNPVDPISQYSTPPSGTIRLERAAESGDTTSEIAEAMAIEYNEKNGTNLDTQEVQDSIYSIGGKTPEGYEIEPDIENMTEVGEHHVADVPIEDVYDK